ncbi:helix-turn-helix domain-containing protein [Anaerofustis stercorihominis]|uniref:XRE family transcriptional regulator n=1 Tax=Anaerofustis stercorihominis TaxID=214853 RepID=A0A3E3DX82_9FIRM|nr:helix-turn-helix transcriptional regulator [Anaerofustis stercorihominis]RGD73850.1 XRE family transcriptional regulator [Anaerofustis stercorihominis]
MTNSNELLKIIKNSGLKKGYIAEKMGICLSTFSRKVNNKVEFNTKQISSLCEILHINDDERNKIFFTN